MGEGETLMGLDLKLCTMKSVNGFVKEAAVEGGDGKATKMEEFVKLLEEEKAKIEVFKRELPLCMNLIGDVIEGLKRDVEKCRMETTKKRKLEEEEETDRRDKMSWMSSAQLWSDNYNDNNVHTDNVSEKKMSREEKRKSASVEINVNGAGAFTPFKGVTAPPPPPVAAKKEEAGIAAVGLPDLSLLSPAMRSSPPTIAVAGDGGRARVVGRGPVAASVAAAAAAAAGPHLSLQPQPQPPQGTPSAAAAAAAAAAARKARRCWSPELHRRFVMALEHLGGAQVATPKQIRELMKVDGLTNDEVKSHLQKYRLHTRRMPNTAPNPNPQVVVMGGLWMQQQQPQRRQQQQEQDTASQQSTSQSGSPQGPLQFNSHGSRALSMTTTTNGDSCEEEDGRSESYSWK